MCGATFVLEFIYCGENDFYFELVRTSSVITHFESLNLLSAKGNKYASEKEVYASAGVQFTEPELREALFEIEKSKKGVTQ